MNNNEQVCENCRKTKEDHLATRWCYGKVDPLEFTPKPTPQVEMITIEPGLSVHDRWTVPKPTPDPKVEQVAKRPHQRAHGDVERGFVSCYAQPDADALFDSQDERIAELEEAQEGWSYTFNQLTAANANMDAKIANLEQELRDKRRALDMAAWDACNPSPTGQQIGMRADEYLEAARKERMV